MAQADFYTDDYSLWNPNAQVNLDPTTGTYRTSSTSAQDAAPLPTVPAFDPNRVPSNVPSDFAEDFLKRNSQDYHRLESAYESDLQGKARDREQSLAQQWTAQPQSQPPDWYNGWFSEMRNRLQADQQQAKERGDTLFEELMARIKQSTDVGPNDPTIRRQSDAYSANQTRQAREYLRDRAEEAGPYGNIRTEQRIAAERAGQASGQFEAEAISNEVNRRREEIMQALSGALGFVSAAQARQLNQELAVLDQMAAEANIGLQDRALTNDMARASMANDIALRNIGLQDWDRQMYWDAVRRGAF